MITNRGADKEMFRFLKKLRHIFFVNQLGSSALITNKMRYHLLRMCGLNINTTSIYSNCHFATKHISIGHGSVINLFCKFFSNKRGAIFIGDNCYVGVNVVFCAYTHEKGDEKQRAGSNKDYPIRIGRGCWIGFNSTILPGVTIGEGSVIAAGSVVVKDCDSNSLYAGVPARKVKSLN
jgi:acetyltransferase-like isoleucine patch superfamily enzyme